MSGFVYCAEIELADRGIDFATPDRATAAEAFADAMRLVGCTTAGEAIDRLGYDWSFRSEAERARRLTYFYLSRWPDDDEGEQDLDWRGARGSYKTKETR